MQAGVASAAAVAAAVADAHRTAWAQVLAATVRVTGDLEVAEECVQDSYARALATWTAGIPANPSAAPPTAARHTAPSGATLTRSDLAERALDLARLLRLLLPDDPDVAGLLALILLTDARRATRTGPDGRLLLLEEQDRSRWDRAAIDEGIA